MEEGPQEAPFYFALLKPRAAPQSPELLNAAS